MGDSTCIVVLQSTQRMQLGVSTRSTCYLKLEDSAGVHPI